MMDRIRIKRTISFRCMKTKIQRQKEVQIPFCGVSFPPVEKRNKAATVEYVKNVPNIVDT
jgi:hypothetical protein